MRKTVCKLLRKAAVAHAAQAVEENQAKPDAFAELVRHYAGNLRRLWLSTPRDMRFRLRKHLQLALDVRRVSR